jgi:hypothetical protein
VKEGDRVKGILIMASLTATAALGGDPDGDKGGAMWYRANTRGAAAPDGFSQEETIKAIWAGK